MERRTSAKETNRGRPPSSSKTYLSDHMCNVVFDEETHGDDRIANTV